MSTTDQTPTSADTSANAPSPFAPAPIPDALALPPIVSSLVRWIHESDSGGTSLRLPDEFVSAWRAMPDFMQSHVDREGCSTTRVTRHTLAAATVRALIDADKGGRFWDGSYGHCIARGLALLEAGEVQGSVESAHVDAGFWIGITFALYLLHGQAPTTPATAGVQ